MTIEAPYPEMDEIMTLIGEAGHRLSEIEATEGAAGNISVYIGWPIDPRRRFPIEETIELPEPAPELAGKAFLVTGSGRRLREIIEAPSANLGFVVVQPDGVKGALYTAPGRLFARLTSEWNSHLAVHRDYIARSGTNFHAIVHAQPLHLTYLSHIPRYQDTDTLSRQLLRWQPESIVNLPQGIGFIPFTLPGSPDLMAATVEGLRRHRIVVWAKHGVMARSDISVKRAGDRIEYAETGARYEYMNLVTGERGVGLTPPEIRMICAAFDIQQTIF
jgi:rhamnulose-1-phosphate aldolase